MVDRTLGLGCWGDPAGDPLSAAWGRAAWAFDVRAGEDGLLLPWPATPAYVNPPYDDCASWLERCVRHAASGHPVLALVPAQPGSLYWRRCVWGVADAVCFVGRPAFVHVVENDDPKGRRAGELVSTQHPTDCAVVGYGVGRERMVATWSSAGPVVAPAELSCRH